VSAQDESINPKSERPENFMENPSQTNVAQRSDSDVATSDLLGVRGFWRSPTGENHGLDSRPFDVWYEPGSITDTDRLDWLESQKHEKDEGELDQLWTEWFLQDERHGINIREAIDAAMRSPNNRSSATPNQ
jgi:hypothetical protein